MTLAQPGADVIRVDQTGGGSDIDRWPLAPSGRGLYWACLNKGDGGSGSLSTTCAP